MSKALFPIQEEAESSLDRKNDPGPIPVENGLSPAPGPTSQTQITTTPKATAANQQAAATGNTFCSSGNPPTPN